jgi:hypothetical protein
VLGRGPAGSRIIPSSPYNHFNRSRTSLPDRVACRRRRQTEHSPMWKSRSSISRPDAAICMKSITGNTALSLPAPGNRRVGRCICISISRPSLVNASKVSVAPRRATLSPCIWVFLGSFARSCTLLYVNIVSSSTNHQDRAATGAMARDGQVLNI